MAEDKKNQTNLKEATERLCKKITGAKFSIAIAIFSIKDNPEFLKKPTIKTITLLVNDVYFAEPKQQEIEFEPFCNALRAGVFEALTLTSPENFDQSAHASNCFGQIAEAIFGNTNLKLLNLRSSFEDNSDATVVNRAYYHFWQLEGRLNVKIEVKKHDQALANANRVFLNPRSPVEHKLANESLEMAEKLKKAEDRIKELEARPDVKNSQPPTAPSAPDQKTLPVGQTFLSVTARKADQSAVNVVTKPDGPSQQAIGRL